MFVSSAFAADTANTVAGLPQALSGAMPMVLIVLVFYILIIRPNQKKIKDHEDMVKSLKRGDKVVTAGGVIGTISKIEDDNVILLEISENVKIRVVRETISHMVTKTIANDNKADDKASGKATEKSGSK